MIPEAVDFGREICGDLRSGEEREWLVTNGLGGFGSGTVAGLLTRRYHGLLAAALRPPLGRILLLSKIDETAEYDGRAYPLFTNRWAGGAIDPHGYRHIERFRLEGTTPIWTFACADALLEKRIWMQQGTNTTYVHYTLRRGSRPLGLTLKALVNYRDIHSVTRAGDWKMTVTPVAHGLSVLGFEGAAPLYLLSARARPESAHLWYYDFDLAAERSRGLEDREDHLLAGIFRTELAPGDSVTLVASIHAAPNLDGRLAWEARRAYERALLDHWAAAYPQAAREAPPWIRQWVVAAHQFIVNRPLPSDIQGHSVIAGYPWFGDWGRDTMIALPGLTLSTGRPEIARSILRTWIKFVDRGMLPNRFPETGEIPEYNALDSTLWLFDAVGQYYAATGDGNFLREFFPVFEEILKWHVRGTRYSIRVDPADGLLYGGEPGVQLTWMDVKLGDRVVTPRIGKPVEVNALWYNALVAMGRFARKLKKSPAEYEGMAQRAHRGFERFWNDSLGYCFDVIDGPEGNDSSLRPNQIFAVSLPNSPLDPAKQRAVVDACARHLLTSFGLRSLAPQHPQYQGRYGGDPQQRDAAYHQGTAWGWLLGAFVLAHLRVYNDPGQAASFLEPMAHHLKAHGVGSGSEIFDGDPPFAPRGCVAQAWTVAEVLRAWLALRLDKTEGKTARFAASYGLPGTASEIHSTRCARPDGAPDESSRQLSARCSLAQS